MIHRPLIDPNPDQPLRFYGCRIDRSGRVIAGTAPARRGRFSPNREVVIGTVSKVGRTWVARTDSGFPFEAGRQADAAKALLDWVASHQ